MSPSMGATVCQKLNESYLEFVILKLMFFMSLRILNGFLNFDLFLVFVHFLLILIQDISSFHLTWTIDFVYSRFYLIAFDILISAFEIRYWVFAVKVFYILLFTCLYFFEVFFLIDLKIVKHFFKY